MKAIESELIIHGKTREFSMGIYPSKAAAKRGAAFITRPFTIRPTNKKLN